VHLARRYAPKEGQFYVFSTVRADDRRSTQQENEELRMLIFLNRANDIKPEPLEVGEGKFHLVDLVSQAQGAPDSSGLAEQVARDSGERFELCAPGPTARSWSV
jgi:hypothetical protein